MSYLTTWIACSGYYRSSTGKACIARARYLVVGGIDAGKCVCGTHARAYIERALQRIEYPA